MSITRSHKEALHISEAAQSQYRQHAWPGMPPEAVTILVGAMEAWDDERCARAELTTYAKEHGGKTNIEVKGDWKRHPALTTIEKARQDIRMGLKRLSEIKSGNPEEEPDEFAHLRGH
jgi:hypothetical protein